LRAPAWSATAPSSGADTATSRLARALTTPKRKLLSVTGTPAPQTCLNITGKKPAMTVVAKVEFAQSYRAQA